MTTGNNSQLIDQHLADARQNLAEKNYNEAIRDLKAVEVLDPGNAEVLCELGAVHSRLGLAKTAINYFRKALALPANTFDTMKIKKLMAYSLINTGGIDEAEKLLNEILLANPTDTMALNLQGYLHTSRGSRDKAEKSYRAVLSIDRTNATAANALAFLLAYTGGNPGEAMTLAQIAYNADRSNPSYLDTMGFVYMKMGNYQRAAQFLQEAQRHAPWSEEIKLHLAELNQLMK